jgi:hypothetical protein
MRLLTFWAVLFLPYLAASAEKKSAALSRVPPDGIAIPAEQRAALISKVAKVAEDVSLLKNKLPNESKLSAFAPDVQIFHKAVDWALRENEFYRSNEFGLARQLLNQGSERAQALMAGKAPWITATGLVVRAYTSIIDGSIQPYGLVVPPNFQPDSTHRYRLDVWLHGRDNNLTELKFIADRLRSLGEFTPPDTIVLHPYGRYCNAFKFAGEMDVIEAIEHVKQNYPIDENRIAIRGFSMGGAGTWHLAAHYGGYWTAAAPGAGFAETALYTRALIKEPFPPSYEQTLWHLYDATDYAANLFNCGVIAYSGELDPQKQAADMMAKALQSEGLSLRHLIGPGVQHKYEPGTKKELGRQFDELMERGAEKVPRRVRLTTFTLRYNQQKWLRVDALEKHWERARIDGELAGTDSVDLKTANIAALTLDFAGNPFGSKAVRATVDGQNVELKNSGTPNVWQAHLVKESGIWKAGQATGLRKEHALQGPIDDAFMEPFLFVRPTQKAMNTAIDTWTTAELKKALTEWRLQFRGDARVKDDAEVNETDLANYNLVLWGDTSSNKILARIADKLPISWSAQEIRVGSKTFQSTKHIPVLIYPNPLNPKRYIVLNSGFTFAEFGAASNAQQTPKLPDYAIIDMGVPAAKRLGSGIALAGFFDEHWKLRD